MRGTRHEKYAGGKFPPAIVYIAMLAWIGVVIALGYLVDVKTASYALAFSLLALAVLRALLPDGAVPRIRSKEHDATIAVILATLLIALARWGNSPPV